MQLNEDKKKKYEELDLSYFRSVFIFNASKKLSLKIKLLEQINEI